MNRTAQDMRTEMLNAERYNKALTKIGKVASTGLYTILLKQGEDVTMEEFPTFIRLLEKCGYEIRPQATSDIIEVRWL